MYTSFAVPGYLNMVGLFVFFSKVPPAFSAATVGASDDEHPLEPEDNEPEVMPLRPYSAEIFLCLPAWSLAACAWCMTMAAVPADPADSVVALGRCGGIAPRDGPPADEVVVTLWWPEAVMLTGSIMLSS
jgi:hypothetical protein